MDTHQDPAKGWSRRQVAKSRYFAAAGALIVVAALWACGQTWVAVALTGQPTCTPWPPSVVSATTVGGSVEVVVPAVCSTGWQLQTAAANTEIQATLTDQYGPTVVRQDSFPSTYGVPSVVLWTAVAGALILFGALARNAIIVAAVLVPWQLSQSAFAGTLRSMTGSLDTSQYQLHLGWTVLTVCGPILAVVALVGTIFIAKTNYRIRKRAAAEEGRAPLAGALKDMVAMVTRNAFNARAGADASARMPD